ncbi:ATP synthase delta subunit [Sarcoptes scabiei]|nr:ATP synthase delta subunit [Sarcoptes scabiei]
MDKSRISHPLLALIIKTYGTIGVQFLSFSNHNLINWLINILIDVFTYYLMFMGETSIITIRQSRIISSDRLLLIYYSDINSRFIFPTICISYMLSFFIRGSKIIELIDSLNRLRSIHQQRMSYSKASLILIATFLANNLIVLVSFTTDMLFESDRKSSIKSTAGILLMTSFHTVTWLLFFIQQFLLCRILEEIYHDRPSFPTMTYMTRIYQKIVNISEINLQIQQEFSFLLFIHLLNATTYMIIAITYITVCSKSNFGYWIEWPLRIIPWIYLCRINKNVMLHFDLIEKHLSNTGRHLKFYQCSKIHFRIKQLKIYKDRFQIIVYSSFKVDLSTLLFLVCFVTSYITIIYQTRKY